LSEARNDIRKVSQELYNLIEAGSRAQGPLLAGLKEEVMIVGFIYDDVSSKDMGVKARLTSWQVSGTLRNYSAAIPGKYGVADFGADMNAREIPVSCSIFPKLRFFRLGGKPWTGLLFGFLL